MTIMEIFNEYWPLILGQLATVAPIMSVMIPKLLNDKRIIKQQKEVVQAVQEFKNIKGGVLMAINEMNSVMDDLRSSASIPASVTIAVGDMMEVINTKVVELESKAQHLNIIKNEILFDVKKLMEGAKDEEV